MNARCAAAFTECARQPEAPLEIVLARGPVESLRVTKDFGERLVVESHGHIDIGRTSVSFRVPGNMVTPNIRKRYELVLREVK